MALPTGVGVRELRMGDRAGTLREYAMFVADGFAGAGFPLHYVGGVVPRLDTAQIDTPHGAEFIDAPAQLNRYRARLERVEGAALPPEASLDIIRRIAQQL
ncbi:Scr1 family TA system antitoxin-like transcriptional regulator [Streptomyces sp. L7]